MISFFSISSLSIIPGFDSWSNPPEGEGVMCKSIFTRITNMNNMKIVLIRKGRILRAYHEPREIIVHPKTNQVDVVNSEEHILEKYELIKRDLGWTVNKEKDTSEIVLTLTIGQTIS